MTQENFNKFILDNPGSLEANKERLASLIFKTSGEEINSEEAKFLRKNLRKVLKEKFNITCEKKINIVFDESTPSLEDLEAIDFKIESTIKLEVEKKPESNVKVPIAPTGWGASSFKINGKGELQDQWFKKEDVKSEIDLSKIQPRSFKVSEYKQKYEDCALTIFQTDSHLDRRELNGRTIQEKIEEYFNKLVQSVETAKKYHSIKEVIYITGSDMFNSDSKNPFTVKGTLQENQSTYDKVFDLIVDLNVNCIDYLQQHCNKVTVIVIPGNHDEVNCYMLGKYLQAYYRKFPITFQVHKAFRKVFTFGKTSIMIHHGDVSKLEILINQFAMEFPTEYTNKYTEVYSGDKHFYQSKEFGKSIIRQFPSLALNDSWSDQMGFKDRGGIVCHVYDYHKGHLLEITL